jgi:hypothetical protein
LQLVPDDAAIMDSVGWGYYRSGKLEESVQLLRQALSATPILKLPPIQRGAVVRGDREEAENLAGQLKANPATRCCRRRNGSCLDTLLTLSAIILLGGCARCRPHTPRSHAPHRLNLPRSR